MSWTPEPPYGAPQRNNPPGYAAYDPYVSHVASPPTNTLALISMILSLVGVFTGVTAVGGIVCGHLARRQIARSGESGDGMALTGLIVGYAAVALWLAYLALVVVYFIAVIGLALATTNV